MEKYYLTRTITKYGWDEVAKETKKFTIDDKYDPMSWDDVINNIGYLVGGHKGEEVAFKIKMEKEEQ